MRKSLVMFLVLGVLLGSLVGAFEAPDIGPSGCVDDPSTPGDQCDLSEGSSTRNDGTPSSEESLDRISSDSEGNLAERTKACLDGGKDKFDCRSDANQLLEDKKDEGDACMSKCAAETEWDKYDEFCVWDYCGELQDEYVALYEGYPDPAAAISAGIEEWEASGRIITEESKKVDEEKEECTGRTLRSLTGEVKCKEESSSATAKRVFTPLFGSIGDDKSVSPAGYPNVKYVNDQSSTFTISRLTDGKFYLISSDGSQALFEGFGIEKGKKIKWPPINPSGLSISSGSGSTKVGAEGEAGEAETGFTANVKGLEDIAEVNVKTVVDPETGEEQLEIEVEIAEDAPEEVQEAVIEILQDGEVVGEIPVAVDVQEPITRINYGKLTLWLVVLGAIIGGVKYGVRKFLSKSAGTVVEAAAQPAAA